MKKQKTKDLAETMTSMELFSTLLERGQIVFEHRGRPCTSS